MATEILVLEGNRTITAEELTKICIPGFTNPPPPGLHGYKCGNTEGHPQDPITFFFWDHVQDHINYQGTQRFHEEVEVPVRPLNKVWPPNIFHVYFDNGHPVNVYNSEKVELTVFKKQDNVDPGELEATVRKFLGAQRPYIESSYCGPKHEDPTTYVLLIGWNSVAAIGDPGTRNYVSLTVESSSHTYFLTD